MKSLAPIEILHLHPRAYAALLANGVEHVEHVLLYDFDDLMELPGMGTGLARSVQETLLLKGKSLASHIHPREKRRREFEEKYKDSHPEVFAHA
jgi:hypothetical protein